LAEAPGRAAEETARLHMEERGYRTVAVNFRAAGGEIDLICEKDGILCFIEVKSRRSGDFGLPAEYVDLRKRRRIIRAAKIFSGRKPWRGLRLRFDIVSLQGGALAHIPSAFEEE
jgi:putative endonuclease